MTRVLEAEDRLPRDTAILPARQRCPREQRSFSPKDGHGPVRFSHAWIEPDVSNQVDAEAAARAAGRLGSVESDRCGMPGSAHSPWRPNNRPGAGSRTTGHHARDRQLIMWDDSLDAAAPRSESDPRLGGRSNHLSVPPRPPTIRPLEHVGPTTLLSRSARQQRFAWIGANSSPAGCCPPA